MLYKQPNGGIVSRPFKIGNTFIGTQTDLTQYGYLPVTPDKPAEPDGQRAVATAGSEVNGEWQVTWVLENIPTPPPEPVELGVFKVSKYAIVADSADTSVVTFTSNDPVPFVVDDELVEVTPVDSVATLNITADNFGPITVFVEGQQATISVYKVPV